ncbi:DUF4440 domain-containing protein [Altererythrobacter sp. ZODW24]|uniref:DUF4440 domain-containing protein n=1 Tax=Altererythrobacter sp. ZODW24 TaxID=2185142 RepID=UPI000DF7C5D8|nr:DUF4440 domain-containing protein [Altererythrobacter sp. ZODW24]
MTAKLLITAAALALAGCSTNNTYNTYPEGASGRVLTSVADPADIAAIDQAVTNVYAVISGPAGQQRDFGAMRAMFTPDARLTAVTPRGLQGGTVEDYIKNSGPFLVESGFTESELARRMEVYGDIAHVWSSYSGTFGEDGSVRGINSFQLVRIEGRWLVQSIFWQAEGPDNPLPADMQTD